MTKHLVFVLLLLCFNNVQASTQLDDHIYSPDNGVICDRKAGFCVDSYGISMAFTKEFLGQKAQDKMMKMIDEVGTDSFDTSRYSLSNNVYCDSEIRACFTDRLQEQSQDTYSKILFN